MPPRYDYREVSSRRRNPPPPSDVPIRPPGHWHHGVFEFADGYSLADDQFVCPYGDHLVEMEDESEFEDEDDPYYEGRCEVCNRWVDINYEPEAVVWRAR